MQKGVASKNLWDYVDLQSYEWECISDPSACSQGLSMSFWLRFKRKYLTKNKHCSILILRAVLRTE